MAFSSPGQARALCSTDQVPATDSLRDSPNGFEICGEDTKAAGIKQQDHLSVASRSPEVNGEDRQGVYVEAGVDHDFVLLEKPSALSKSIDLGKGYEYGPAIKFGPDYFTKRPGKRTRDHQDGRHENTEQLSPRVAGAACSPRSQMPSLGSEPTHDVENNEFKATNVLNRPRTQPSTRDHRDTSHNSDKLDRTEAGREDSQMDRKLSSSDIPCVKRADLSTQDWRTEVENGSPGALSEEGNNCQGVLPALDSASKAKPCASSAPLQSHSNNATSRPRPCWLSQSEPLTATAENAVGYHHNAPVPLTGDPQHSAKKPRDWHQSRMVNRPVREIADVKPIKPVHHARPESRSSNISKSRSRCGSLASSPMVWQRRAKISHEFTTEIAGVINQFTQQQSAAIEEQKAKYHKYIKRLKRELVEESGVITQQMSQIDAQANRIEDLQNSKEHVESQMKEIKAKLEASESRIRRLEEKYRACKTHLNSAIQEQQDLYTRSKKQWEDTIEEVRRIEKSRNLETEMTVRKAEAVREQMMEKVRQTIAQSKSEAVELYGKINTLTQQVEEKDAELSRERESVRFLTEKLQNIESVSSSFEALSSQGRDILQRIEEEQMRAEERQQQSMKGIRDRIDVVSARLETLSNIMSEQPDILSSLREVQKDSWDNITGKLDSILELRSAATEATSQLSADLEHQLGKVWQRLDSQIETLTRQLAEKAEENGMVSTLYKRNDAECEEHLNELAILRATTEKQANQIHELEASLIASDTVHDENEKTIRLLEARGAEAEKLKRELESKAAAVVELQSKLDAKEGAYVSELQNYSSNIHELAKAFQEKDRSLATVAHQAAETARYETQLKTERIQTKLEQSLQETTLHRDSLIDQLRKLETTIQEKEQNEMRQAETICSLRQRVAVEEAKTQAAAQQLSQQSANLEQVEHRLGSQIKDLETKLRAASDLISGLENENQRQHARSETIAAGLKNWAHKEGVLIDEFDNLGTSDRSEKEISDFLTHTLELVLSARRSQTTSLETNPTGSVLGMENSSFLAGQTAEAPQAALQDHCQNDRVESDNPSGAMAYQTKREGDAVGRRHVKEPLSHAPTLHNLRRVVVRSPANVPSEPAAPSIDQEKMRRREAMQPKSIMKRVTRSATSKLRLEDSSFAAEDGTFNINEQDATQSAVPQKQEDSASYAESMALNTDTPENKEALSRHPKKRRRSRTAGSEDWAGSSTNLGHGGKGESSKHSTELKTERMDSRVYISVATGHEEKGARPRTNKYDSYGEKPVARHPRRHSDSGPQDLPRTLSATNPKRLSQRQTNVRTYGSQRATGDPLELQPLLQSQSESRYWRLRSKAESQEPVTS